MEFEEEEESGLPITFASNFICISSRWISEDEKDTGTNELVAADAQEEDELEEEDPKNAQDCAAIATNPFERKIEMHTPAQFQVEACHIESHESKTRANQGES